MVTIMELPAGIEARPIDEADMAAWAELLAASEMVDQVGENYDAEDLLEEFHNPKLNAEADTIGLWAGGTMVGYGAVHWRVNVVDVHRVGTEGTVHPEWRGRGLGTALVPWMVRRGTELHEEKHPESEAEIGAFVTSTNTSARELLTAHGFEECRYFFSMRRLLDTPVPGAAETLHGCQMVAFDPSYDEALRAAHNEAFRGHWGSTPLDEEIWTTFYTGSRGFRGGLSQLVLDEDKIVSFALGYEYVADTAATGVREAYIGQVGTLRSHRRRGLARAALAALMTEAQHTGYERAALDVDTVNPTGALGLYEGLGFATVKKAIAYRLPLQ